MKAKYVEFGGKLALICVCCMLGVAGAYVLAKDTIEEGKLAAFNTAIAAVLGAEPDPEPLNPEAELKDQVFTATVDGEKRYAAQGVHPGYSGAVAVAVGAGFDTETGHLRILEARVITQTETPGLGTRIAEQETNLTLWTKAAQSFGADVKEETDWFFLKRYRGKGIENLLLTADPAEADERILRITGVTISTNACTVACKKALTKIQTEILESLR